MWRRLHDLAAMTTVVLFVVGAFPASAAGFLTPDEAVVRTRAVVQEDYPGEIVVRVHSSTEVSVSASGTAVVRQQVVDKALSELGAKSLSVLRFDYDPATSEVSLQRIWIVRQNGRIEEVEMGRVLDLPQPMHSIYWPLRMKLVSLPPLEAGDGVLWERSSVGFQIAYLGPDSWEDPRFTPPQRGEYYDVVLFGTEYPVVFQEWTVLTPADKPLYYTVANGPLEVEVGVTETEVRRLKYRFVGRDLPSYGESLHAPPLSDIVPKVVLSTLENWSGRSRWFYMVNEPMFELTEEIEELALRLVEGRNGDLERIGALNRWVAHNIRYSGVTMGDGEGYTIHPAAMTLRDRMGVCKDKAGLLVALMRAAGYKETYAAMTMAGSRVENIAADQFNHAVVVWRRPDGGIVLVDPTWAPLSMELWSNYEGGQYYVPGTPQGDTLRRSSDISADENLLRVDIESRIAPEGEFSGEVEMEGRGAMDTALRRWFGTTPESEWGGFLDSMAAAIWPAAEITESSLTRDDLEDLDRPFTLEFAFKSSLGWRERPAHFYWRPASFRFFVEANSRFTENLTASSSPLRGFRFWTRKRFHFHEEIRLPGRYLLVSWSDVSFRNSLGSLSARVELKGKTLVVDLVISFDATVVLPEQMDAYRDLMTAVGNTRASWLELMEGKP